MLSLAIGFIRGFIRIIKILRMTIVKSSKLDSSASDLFRFILKMNKLSYHGNFFSSEKQSNEVIIIVGYRDKTHRYNYVSKLFSEKHAEQAISLYPLSRIM